MQTVALKHERDMKAGEAVAAGARRIARELHDVVAHTISVMVCRRRGAAPSSTRDPARRAAALDAIEQTGREALAEMRRLLGVLRPRTPEAALAPQPGLGQLDDLVEQLRAAGLPVELRVEGEPRRAARRASSSPRTGSSRRR